MNKMQTIQHHINILKANKYGWDVIGIRLDTMFKDGNVRMMLTYLIGVIDTQCIKGSPKNIKESLITLYEALV